MSNRKTLASRESPEDNRVSLMQDMLFMVLEAKNGGDRIAVEEFPEDLDECIAQLEDGIVELALSHDDLVDKNLQLANDNVILNVGMQLAERELLKARSAIEDLVQVQQPVTNTVLQKLMNALKVRAHANVNTQTITYSFEVTESNDIIRDAIASAIKEYNLELIETLYN